MNKQKTLYCAFWHCEEYEKKIASCSKNVYFWLRSQYETGMNGYSKSFYGTNKKKLMKFVRNYFPFVNVPYTVKIYIVSSGISVCEKTYSKKD